MKNPHFGIWPKDDDLADNAKDKKRGGLVKIDSLELETIEELKAHRRLFRSKIRAMRDQAFAVFLKGDEKPMHEIKKMEKKINLINQTISELEGK